MWRVTLQIAKAARGTSSCFDVHLVAFAPQLAARSKLHLPPPPVHTPAYTSAATLPGTALASGTAAAPLAVAVAVAGAVAVLLLLLPSGLVSCSKGHV